MHVAVVAVLAVVVAVYLGGYLRLLLDFLRRRRHMDKLTATMREPPGRYPIIGHSLQVVGSMEGLYDRLLALGVRFGPLFRLWLGPYLFIAVLDPDDLQVVFNHPHLASKPDLYRVVEDAMGQGLVIINGADHRRHRKAVTASLHFDILKDFVSTFNSTARDLQRHLDKLAATGEVFEVTPVVGRCSSLSVCKTLLSCEPHGLEAERAAYVDSVLRGNHILMHRLVHPWYSSDLVFRFLNNAMYREYKSLLDNVVSFTRKVLELKLQRVQTTPGPQPATTGPAAGGSAPRSRRRTFLDLFLASPEASILSLEELQEELKTLLVSGSATSMDFLSFFMVVLAMYPEEQRKVQKEVDDVLGVGSTRDVLASDLPHFTYLECAIKETLRLFPPVPMFLRRATQDVELPSGQAVPEGSLVAIVPMLAQRSPRYFDDPLRFDPARFLPDRGADRHPYAYVPFSAGSRNCIGSRYATMFAKTVAAAVLRRYDVLPDPGGPRRIEDVELVGGLSMTIKGGAFVRLRRRHCGAATPA